RPDGLRCRWGIEDLGHGLKPPDGLARRLTERRETELGRREQGTSPRPCRLGDQEKELPQPQVRLTLGLSMETPAPRSPSLTPSVEPRSISADCGSTTTLTSPNSSTMPESSTWLSKKSWKEKPGQPPGRTA